MTVIGPSATPKKATKKKTLMRKNQALKGDTAEIGRRDDRDNDGPLGREKK